MTRTRATGSTEILGTFVGKDEVEAALAGSHSDREAMARRIASSLGSNYKSIRRVMARRGIVSSLGYDGHLAFVRGDADDYTKMVDAAKRAGKITEPQLEVLTQLLFKTVDPQGTSPHRDGLRKILRSNLTQGGVKIVRA
jgi:hypothetical protein